ncbi:AlbA family DNA-binding domain-containing protein [Candidatus Contendibacter odensensis]|uniref:Schlafen AlbA-2 domain-containing protein n=1 Tax=Candidatus Contendobacter odensis Run_B_J11 TaxID=1400861 RepID=A0A7U7J2S2_9GAMM|nr:hypothetical protein [Candidatus Contendobacter odensis]CDH44457.1 hypothetical protein BN874_1680033 [Candidatus Contendobacter odensis Run_B_J11]
MSMNETDDLVAFANCGGGLLIIGASNLGEVQGLSAADISRLNQLLYYSSL